MENIASYVKRIVIINKNTVNLLPKAIVYLFYFDIAQKFPTSA